jgi:serine protease Do
VGLGLADGATAFAWSDLRSGSGYGVRGSSGTRVGQSYLGIDVRDVSEDRVSVLRMKDRHGAEIIRVDHDGPAGKMGLRERDVVVQLNGTAVEGEEQVRRMLRELAPGHNVTLVVVREGQQMTMSAQMADRDQVERQAWLQHLSNPAAAASSGPQAPASGLPSGAFYDESGVSQAGASGAPSRYSKGFLGTLLMSPSYTGVILEKMGPQLAEFFGSQSGMGLLVRSVEVNSPAAQAGLRAGDVVVRANAQNVASMADWAKQIKEAKGRPVSVVVLRDKAEHTLTLTPDGKRRSKLDVPADGIQVACLTEM